MFTDDDYQALWLIYYLAGLVFVLGIVLLTWRWRVIYMRVWIPMLFAAFVAIPLPIDETGQHFAPMLAVWLMSLFSA
jgi:hypothetical protein